MKRALRYVVVLAVLTGSLFAITRASSAAQSPVIINEVLVGNAGTNLDARYTNFASWIELYNTSDGWINLNGYKLESWPDGATTPDSVVLRRLRIPPNGYLILWADERRGNDHLPFELDMDGGELRLTAPDASFDHVDFTTDQSMDVSYGRNAGGVWAYFDIPTPGAANTTPDYPDNDEDDNFAAPPTFSVEGGLHTGSFDVELTTTTPLATIRYTTDGSRPTAASPEYTGPITVNGTTIIRARTWADGLMVSPTATETYLIDIPTNLPIISLVTDDANLFDNKIGLYVKGTNGAAGCRGRANWHQKWERPANIEFYEKTGPATIVQEINQEIGLEISGNCSRNFPQKSFEIKARKTYGDNDMDYAFFAPDKPMTSYKRLILRNAGQDNQNAFIRDPLVQSLSIGVMDLDRQAYRPVVLYLNGEYWGLYNMREKADEDLIENNYDLDEDEFDMLELGGSIINGSTDAWRSFETFVRRNNVASPAVYAEINAQMDVSSFIDYMILETFVANSDWPANNVRWWDDHATDYRWRWVLQDVDFSFLPKNMRRDMIVWAMRKPGPTSLFFRQLWQNDTFQDEFAQRYAVHLNTTFQPAAVNALIDTMTDRIRPEMTAHTARWADPVDLADWEREIATLRRIVDGRYLYARETLRRRIGTPPDATLTVNVVGAGRVLVAGAPVPNTYSGPHFAGIPMTLTAVPEPGQLFSYWQETGETSASITLPFTGPTTRTAVFESEPPPPPPPPLVINELHYNPAGDDDPYEFLELVNTGSTAVDLSGFAFTAGIEFVFPAGASMDPGEIIVLAKMAATYVGNGYDVYEWTDGSLSNSGETVTLEDTFGQVVDTVPYGEATPWPPEADGTGPSLALLDPALDNSQGASWAAGAVGGTPGAVNFVP